jgi:hypothetical protein
MAIRINTSKFEASHARQPKGAGTWAFSFNGGETFFTPWAPSYTAACAEAKRRIKRDHKVQDGVLDLMP